MFNLRHLKPYAEESMLTLEMPLKEAAPAAPLRAHIIPQPQNTSIFAIKMASTLHDFESTWDCPE
ncbi:uncharacterized protein NEMAJ01_0004 [Nematocida major]|uniref:uncharacterized protein n=1 Tax=Nematocida major TaxID=1912982 RepID=UPI0020083209|nr:uncharacterized protein NEMAJ01_0004 [Nematocida major]KAH9385108.1 hypothetical protein NEMAJ01_0004 [Nematocida major]